MKLITAKTFDNPIEAHLLKSKLESEGIICFLFDENIVSLNPLYNVTVGGIKLKIREADSQRVFNLLKQLEGQPNLNKDGEQLECPRCQSTALYTNFKSMKGLPGILTAIVSFLMVVFPFYLKTVYRCKDCGKEFNNP